MKRKQFKQAWQLLFTPEAIIPFIVATLALTVIASATYDLLLVLLGSDTSAQIKLILIGGAVLAAMLLILVRFVGKIAVAPPKLGLHPPSKRRGLILLVSKEEPCEHAVNYHYPDLQMCWLLHSPQTWSTADQLRQKIEDKGIAVEMVLLKSAYDALEVRDAVEKIYTESLPKDWTEDHVISDFTGMTALASVGMVLACLSPNRSLEYVPAVLGPNQIPQGSAEEPVEVHLSWDAVALGAK